MPHTTTQRIVGDLSAGVWLFFAVSGFLIAGPFLRWLLGDRGRPPSGPYAVRRAVRILPAYWIAFGAMLILVSGGQILHWWQVPLHATLLHGLVPQESQRLYFVAWTLGREAIFYALVPIGAAIIWRVWRRANGIDVNRLGGLLVGLWAVTVAWGVMLAFSHPFGPQRPMAPRYTVLYVVVGLGNFCPGMLVFLAETREAVSRGGWWARYRALVSRPVLASGLTLALFVLAELLPWQSRPFAYPVFHLLVGLASGLFLGVVLHSSSALFARLTRLLAPIGLISYGVYLWHWVILMFMEKHAIYPIESFGLGGTVINIALLFVLTLPLALVSWVLIERPLLRRTALWDTRRSRRKAHADAVAAEPAQA